MTPLVLSSFKSTITRVAVVRQYGEERGFFFQNAIYVEDRKLIFIFVIALIDFC